jgi:amidohydrolase
VEDNALPFASKVRGSYRGQSVGVMHACGHDAHTAILLGVAELLTQRRKELSGEVMFVFQPAEEGPPEVGQPFGAALMLQEGVFAKFKPDAIFGLHVWAALPVGQIGFRAGPTMAAADEWTLRIAGKQTHGSRPWDGVDPITVAAQIQLALQNIVARQIDIVKSPIVLTTGAISGGVRYNIIPDTVNMTGTLRSFDPAVRADVIARFNRTAKALAEASGATAELVVSLTAPLTSNDVTLSAQAAASLQRSMGVASVVPMPLLTIAEDFSQFSAIAPTFYYFVGATAPDVNPKRAPMNHSPQFMLDEKALQIGAESMTQLALDTLK